MGATLDVLIVEDSASDADLVTRLLRKADYDVRDECVATAETMQAALDRQSWDVIISDYRLSQFDAPAALALLQRTGRDIPFIVVSGTVGEETAVAMMKKGAHDYLMKDKLLRLASAVTRELREAQVRRVQCQAAADPQKLSRAVEQSPTSVTERKVTAAALRASEQRFATIFQASSIPIAITRVRDNQFVDVNTAWQTLTGYTYLCGGGWSHAFGTQSLVYT